MSKKYPNFIEYKKGDSKLTKIAKNYINVNYRKDKRNILLEEKQRKNDKLAKKLEIFNHYCKNNIRCVCCGERTIGVLTVDHINNDGAKMRKEIQGHVNLYVWLKKHNYPDGFQILCYNCNIGKYRNGGKCFHIEKLESNNDWEYEL